MKRFSLVVMLALAMSTTLAVPMSSALTTAPEPDGYITGNGTTMHCWCYTWPNGVKWCFCAG